MTPGARLSCSHDSPGSLYARVRTQPVHVEPYPKIRVRNSRSKPFKTDNTKINTATPSVSPAIDTAEINEMK
jgi:hypothetical protein